MDITFKQQGTLLHEWGFNKLLWVGEDRGLAVWENLSSGGVWEVGDQRKGWDVEVLNLWEAVEMGWASTMLSILWLKEGLREES